MADFFSRLCDNNFLIIAFGSGLLGLISGMVGTFAVLRKQSLLGDAISHAALPGIALAFLLAGTNFLLLGAFTAGIIVTYLINVVVKKSKINYDNALALALSVFFGLGIVLISIIQRNSGADKEYIESFIFGDVSTLVIGDIIPLIIVGAFLLLTILLFWKEFKMFSFDAEFTESVGFSTKRLDLIISLMIVIAIIVGLQTVGAVLMSAMLIAPAVAARQWTDKLWLVVLLSALIGFVSGIIGTAFSYNFLPTGPVIIIVVSIAAIFSLMFAPKRGIVYKLMRRKKTNQEDS